MRSLFENHGDDEVKRLRATSKGRWAGRIAELEADNAQLRAEVEQLQAHLEREQELTTWAADTAAAGQAEIERLQAATPDVGDGPCDRCGGNNPAVWFVSPNERWNEVMGTSSGILCPNCYFALVQERGFDNGTRCWASTCTKILPSAHYWSILVSTGPVPRLDWGGG